MLADHYKWPDKSAFPTFKTCNMAKREALLLCWLIPALYVRASEYTETTECQVYTCI